MVAPDVSCPVMFDDDVGVGGYDGYDMVLVSFGVLSFNKSGFEVI